jgi:hypothetical protein
MSLRAKTAPGRQRPAVGADLPFQLPVEILDRRDAGAFVEAAPRGAADGEVEDDGGLDDVAVRPRPNRFSEVVGIDGRIGVVGALAMRVDFGAAARGRPFGPAKLT